LPAVICNVPDQVPVSGPDEVVGGVADVGSAEDFPVTPPQPSWMAIISASPRQHGSERDVFTATCTPFRCHVRAGDKYVHIDAPKRGRTTQDFPQFCGKKSLLLTLAVDGVAHRLTKRGDFGQNPCEEILQYNGDRRTALALA
jgi:hypothetical protein